MTPLHLNRWRDAVYPRPAEDDDRSDIEAIAELLFTAEERAKEILEGEQPIDDDDYGVDDVIPEIAVRDDAGRAIAGIRLEREPGTDRFTLFLLTTTEQP